MKKNKVVPVALFVLCMTLLGCGRPQPTNEASILVSALADGGADVISSELGGSSSIVILYNQVLSGIDPFKELLNKKVNASYKKAGMSVKDQIALDVDAVSFISGEMGEASDKGIKEDAYTDLVNEFPNIDAFVSFAGPVHHDSEGGVDVPLIVVMPYGMPHVGRMEESLMNGEALMWIVRHPAWPDVMSVADLSPEEQFKKLFMVVTKDTLDAYFDASR